MKKNTGFTLIELSIVLVIIGLIAGGVLVGQDLIRASEVRATVGQYEKYNGAVNAFRTRFNGLPGDLPTAAAASFGIFNRIDMDGTPGKGDGNTRLVDNLGGADLGGETVVFWRHLSDAKLVDGSYGQTLNTAGEVRPANMERPQDYVPTAKLGRGNFFFVGFGSGFNHYLLGGVEGTMMDDGSNAIVPYAARLTPTETYNIDIKIDDGRPNKGAVVARSVTQQFSDLTDTPPGDPATWATGPALQAGICITGGSGADDPQAIYNLDKAFGGTAGGCLLRMRFN